MSDQPPFAQQFAHFLTRTSTQYSNAPLSTLKDRGIESRLLDNLIEHLPDGAIIAGGFMTTVLLDERDAKDIDVFFTSESAFRAMVAKLTAPVEDNSDAWAYQGYTIKGGKLPDLDKLGDTRFLVFEHPKRPALQLLRMVWYDSPAHVIDTFDITVSQFAADKTGLTFNPLAWIDLSRKRIVLHRLQFPSSSLRRLIKYAAKGFYACPGPLHRICE